MPGQFYVEVPPSIVTCRCTRSPPRPIYKAYRELTHPFRCPPFALHCPHYNTSPRSSRPSRWGSLACGAPLRGLSAVPACRPPQLPRPARRPAPSFPPSPCPSRCETHSFYAILLLIHIHPPRLHSPVTTPTPSLYSPLACFVPSLVFPSLQLSCVHDPPLYKQVNFNLHVLLQR